MNLAADDDYNTSRQEDQLPTSSKTGNNQGSDEDSNLATLESSCENSSTTDGVASSEVCKSEPWEGDDTAPLEREEEEPGVKKPKTEGDTSSGDKEKDVDDVGATKEPNPSVNLNEHSERYVIY